MQQDKKKILLYLKKSSLDKLGQAPIMGRTIYTRTMAQFSTKLFCRPELWNTRESRLNGKSREAVVTNAKLEQLLVSIQRAYERLCERGVDFTTSDIKEEVQDSMQSRTTFLQRYDQMLEELAKLVGIEITKKTLESYLIIRKHLQGFISEYFQCNDISFGQITEDFLDELHFYCIGKCKYSQGYYRKTALAVKKVCRLAYREGLTDRLLFEHIKIERGDSCLPRALDRVVR